MEEKIIKKGPANWQNGLIAVGGHLILTDKSLCFEGHKFNIGEKQNEILLKDIKSVQTGFLNNLIITDKNGKNNIFVVFDKNEWKKEIDNLIGG